MADPVLFQRVPATEGLEDNLTVPAVGTLPKQFQKHNLAVAVLSFKVYQSVQPGLEERFRFQKVYVVLAHLTGDGKHHVYTIDCCSLEARDQAIKDLSDKYKLKDYIWGKMIGNGTLRP